MNLDEKYRAWKERPIPLNIPPDFAGDVMRRVHREASQRQAFSTDFSTRSLISASIGPG